MDSQDLLLQLCKFASVSGFEKNFSVYLQDLFKNSCDQVEVDAFYNVIGLKKGFGSENKLKILVSAHMDEIGMMVNSIDENGFVRFTNVGGIDGRILPAQEVTIHGRRQINGVIGARPPHLLDAESAKKALKMKELYIDTGMKADDLKKYVSIGDFITISIDPVFLNEKTCTSKALDNRCGVAGIVGIMKRLESLRHEHDIYFAATSQEEVDLTGIITAAYNIRPDVAVVLDASHGDIPDAAKEDIFTLSGGPAIGRGPNLHKQLTKKIIEVAKSENIPYQIDIEHGDSGTEAWALQVSRKGIPTVLLSIPVRYMHTPVEVVNLDDIKNTEKLAVEFILKLQVNDIT